MRSCIRYAFSEVTCRKNCFTWNLLSSHVFSRKQSLICRKITKTVEVIIQTQGVMVFDLSVFCPLCCTVLVKRRMSFQYFTNSAGLTRFKSATLCSRPCSCWYGALHTNKVDIVPTSQYWAIRIFRMCFQLLGNIAHSGQIRHIFACCFHKKKKKVQVFLREFQNERTHRNNYPTLSVHSIYQVLLALVDGSGGHIE